ncbi:uncharacterized protein FOMMEDRAFT_169184 [Fomitiporia mediterranea MF3/22]|uniref:uncharacterized protein n=1 Tax=Fomitiporia mediterranea (strain MF3/22) TaxID=694068 RepID=UPI0004409CA6|nr:uncharacterized protein FOMMEDRAFT_169184 [Fomitiporia mediterranea MF3/22]EJD00972.1 hypothetical protein FOMMEDRAFT_169184 [Fomitiporia mediterranea MF3/22]
MSEGHFIETFTVPETFKSKTLRDRDVLEWNTSCQEAFQRIDAKQTPNPRTVACLAQLTGNADWLHPDTSRLAEELLCSFDIKIELVKSVLEFHVKPLFVTNPHPQLNISTGRSLHRIAGGPMASQDYYDEQTWKNHPSLSNLISWCISQIPTQDFEQVWHLLIPPVMTFLDDYQSPYKLRGVMLVSKLLDRVSPNLLKRTGIAQLLMSSLSRTLMSLHDELSPRVIRTTVPVTLRLIEMITPLDSAEQFDKLCSLLGDSIIGAVWIYASREKETIEASMDVLPLIIQALGIGTVRYLKALIPQCLHSITINDLTPRSRPLERAALKALLTVIQECQPRMYHWKGTIIEGVGKYWISNCEGKEKSEEDDATHSLVQEIFVSLSKACPSVLQDEYPRLVQVEPNLMKSVIMTA